jgi:S-DNA-T family DNA segregation ATPase FtsK/SpoIIIE
MSTSTDAGTIPQRTLLIQVAVARLVPAGPLIPQDCRVSYRDDVTLAGLIAAVGLRVVFVIPRAWEVTHARTGKVFGRDAYVAAMQLLHGDLLMINEIIPEADVRLHRDSEPPTLEVMLGPEAGRRIALTGASCRVGSGEGDVLIRDSEIAPRHLTFVGNGLGWILHVGAKTLVGGQELASGASVELIEETTIRAGRSGFVFQPGVSAPAEVRLRRRRPVREGSDGSVTYDPAPRVAPPPLGTVLPVPPVPIRQAKPRLRLMSSLMMAALGVVLWRVTGQALMLLMIAIGPVITFSDYGADLFRGRKDFATEAAAFRIAIAALVHDLAVQLEEERRARLSRWPSPQQVTQFITGAREELWRRRRDHSDYLQLRVGVADQLAELRVEYAAAGDPELTAERDAAIPLDSRLHAVPVVISLAEAPVIGVCGPAGPRTALVRSLLLQLSALHSPRNVQLVVVVAPEATADWDWVKWLPHVQSGSWIDTGTGAISTTHEGARAIFRAVSRQLMDAGPGYQARDRPNQQDLVIVVDSAGVGDRYEAAKVFAASEDSGVHVIWHAEREADLPTECDRVIGISRDGMAREFSTTTAGEVIERIVPEGVTVSAADQAVRLLAPLRDSANATRGSASLPDIAHLSAIDRLDGLDYDQLLERWGEAPAGLITTLGVGPDGAMRLDFDEYGPHALVGGTTRAGKSELLRAALASLCLRYSPEDVTFLLFDYKGGSAFDAFENLPHTVGVVTDLDEALADRVIVSLAAECSRRETLLKDYPRASKYTDVRRMAPDLILPRLLVVVDEFAKLVEEIPSFVDRVIDTTQRGGSLGVHLVLATQSPKGIISSRIRANTNISIALRTLSADESRDIIRTEDAWRLSVRPKGRAWVHFGGADLVPIQAAYVGGDTLGPDAEVATALPFTINAIDRSVADAERDETAHEGIGADLAAIVALANEAHASSEREEPHRPWREPPPALINALGLSEFLGAPAPPGCIGVIDKPALQGMLPLTFEPEQHGVLFIAGAPRSGLTTALATVAATLAAERDARDFNVYGIDAASRNLRAVEELPHCGEIVSADDSEKLERLLAKLLDEITARKDRLAGAQVSSIIDLRRLSGETMPAILLLIDNYGAFEERYERYERGRLVAALRRVITDGQGVGIYCAITADRRLPLAVNAVVGKRVTLRLGDRDDYSRMGLPTALADTFIPVGGGFDDQGARIQLATWAEEHDEPLRTALARVGAELARAVPPEHRPPSISILPKHVPRKTSAELSPWTAYAGVRETDALPAIVDLRSKHFFIAGSYGTGRSTALMTIMRGLAESTPGLQTHFVAFGGSTLGQLPEWTSVHDGPTRAALQELFERITAPGDDPGPHLVVIDNASELADTDPSSPIAELLRVSRRGAVRVIASGETQSLRVAYVTSWQRELLKDCNGGLLAPNLELDGSLFGVRLPFQRELDFPDGRGFLVSGPRQVELVQFASDAAR